ncbi:hypothetical protein [Fictibacillus sp. S7]|nr:hypothetical protein [Fictibacillus sp. S7]
MEKKTIRLLFIIVVLLLFSGCSNGKQANAAFSQCKGLQPSGK